MKAIDGVEAFDIFDDMCSVGNWPLFRIPEIVCFAHPLSMYLEDVIQSSKQPTKF